MSSENGSFVSNVHSLAMTAMHNPEAISKTPFV